MSLSMISGVNHGNDAERLFGQCNLHLDEAVQCVHLMQGYSDERRPVQQQSVRHP